jgi:hypothetical protein
MNTLSIIQFTKFIKKIKIIYQFFRISYASNTVRGNKINLNKSIYINDDRLMITKHIENLKKVNLKLRRERQTTEYQIVKHTANRRNIKVNKI